MSYIESPVETVAKFIPSWRSSHPKRLSEEIVSVFNETNRNADPFKLVCRNGTVLDYETREPVRVDRSGYLGQKEGEFFDALSWWLSENDKGTAVWISPLLDGVYPCNKITIYQVIETVDKEKTTLNTSILLDTPAAHCLAIASKLNPCFNGCTDAEVLRNKLFSMAEDFDLSALLELASTKLNSKQSPGQETIGYFMGLIYSGYDPEFIAEKMFRKGVVGRHAVSCAPISQSPNPTFGVFIDFHSFVFRFTGGESGKFVKNCGRCGIRIQAKISKGYKCSKCGGVYLGC